tara:strand:- start:1724 stop:1978 length:255 start_codon:yes stop_codon:yes gene_type:complete
VLYWSLLRTFEKVLTSDICKPDWDSLMIANWNEIENEMAIISTYPKNFKVSPTCCGKREMALTLLLNRTALSQRPGTDLLQFRR